MRGEHIGTLFHKDAHLWFDLKETGARDMAVAARDASRRLQVFYSQNHSNISRIR
jgi:delta-1-pyrroline-5-carboxylate synthetase